MNYLFCLMICFLFTGAGFSDEPAFYVSPTGSDANDGQSLQTPFQTLEKARQAVQKTLDAGEIRDITVQIRNGRYVLTEPVVFGLEDSARKEGQQITYEAFPGETPVFSSLMPIDDWEPVVEIPEGIPDEAAGHLFKTDIHEIANVRKSRIANGLSVLPDWRIKLLYQDNTRIPRAAGERFDPEVMYKALGIFGGYRFSTVAWPVGAFRDFDSIRDAELKIIPKFDWSMNILPIASVNEQDRTCKTVVPGTYPLELAWKWKHRP
ncbi:MAG: hypothetical protein AB7E95_04670, partial [Kiritimatiellales bacterium]